MVREKKKYFFPSGKESQGGGGETGWGEATSRAKGQDDSKDRNDSFLSGVPRPPPVSFLRIGFIECNILIKNTHTFPFGCIKRFLTKHCNVAINFPPTEPSQVITQLWHSAFNVYFDGYVPAGVGARGGERGGRSASPPLLAMPCVFLIKSPQAGEPTLGKGGGKS